MNALFSQDFVFHALLVSALMGLLLAYLGVHVVGRGIVFVDLALGQISMLGVAFADLIDKDPTVIAIAFTMVGAFCLSFVNVTDRRLKQEAIIGIVYAVASACTVLLISKTPHGESAISEVLFGSVFTVTAAQIHVLAIVFAVIGVVQIVFRRKFFELTERIEGGTGEKVGVFNFWNFVFYLSIGLAIVLAVRIAGVIPVFSYLIIPPVSAILMGGKRALLVAGSLVLSVVASVVGVWFSVQFDFPAGSSVVAVLGGVFFLAAFVRLLRRRRAATN